MDINTDQAFKLIEGIKIPPMPYIIDCLHKELQKDEPELSEIAKIIAQDVGISALVLKTANSPLFGLRVKVQSIQQATNLLGMKNIISIVSGLALKRAFDDAGNQAPPNFWSSPSNIALVAASIAKKTRGVASDEAYILGLFHNVGHALLIQKFPDYYDFLEANLNSEDAVVTDLEDRKYSTNHAVLGYFLASSWGMERKIVKIIRDHHHAEVILRNYCGKVCKEGLLLAVLKMAEHIDKLFLGLMPDYEWEQSKAIVLDYIGLSEPDFIDLRQDMLDKLTFDS